MTTIDLSRLAGAQPSPTPLLDTRQLAAQLNVPVSWVYDNIDLIPRKRLGREWRFRQSEIDRWLDDGSEAVR